MIGELDVLPWLFWLLLKTCCSAPCDGDDDRLAPLDEHDATLYVDLPFTERLGEREEGLITLGNSNKPSLLPSSSCSCSSKEPLPRVSHKLFFGVVGPGSSICMVGTLFVAMS